MKPRARESLNFLGCLLGLITEPSSTTETLLSDESPRFAGTIVLCLFLTIFVPIFSQLLKYGWTIYDSNAIFSLFLVVFLTMLIFMITEGIFLQILGVEVSLRHLFACVAYCSAPLMFAIWLIYLFNYLATGGLTLVTLIIVGYSSSSDKFLQVVPVALFIAQLNVFLVFFYSVRYFGTMLNTTAIFVTILSIIPFYSAFILALLLGNLVRPGTFDIFMKILTSPTSLTVYGH